MPHHHSAAPVTWILPVGIHEVRIAGDRPVFLEGRRVHNGDRFEVVGRPAAVEISGEGHGRVGIVRIEAPAEAEA